MNVRQGWCPTGIAWIDSDVHPRDAAGTCEHCDRIAAIFAALTPTESEAK